MAQCWHEDFEDEAVTPEQFDDFEDDFEDDDEDDFDDEEYDEELARDQILERQELEDFEGFDPFESDLGNEW